MVLPTLNDNVKMLFRNSPELQLNFENIVIHSKLTDFVKQVPDSGLSIKTAVNGEEHYYLNGELHTVQPNRYLVVNKHQQFECILDSEEEVEAFCIYLSEELIKEVWSTKNSNLGKQLDFECEQNPSSIRFMEKIYHVQESSLGIYLSKVIPELYAAIHRGGVSWDFNSFYYLLAEKLIDSHKETRIKMSGLPAVKSSTKEELYKRLSLAFSYICDNYTKDIQLDELSRVAAISKYHLLRSFKSVYGITPYQKVLQLRLEKAKELLHSDYNLEEIAYEVGFSDRRSFTKAFKKAYQAPPSAYRA